MILSNREVRVLNEIRKIAAAGEPMPTNEAMAAKMGMSDRIFSHVVGQLNIAGRIKCEKIGGNGRVVHVDGMSTGAPVFKGSTARPRERPERRVETYEETACRVYREKMDAYLARHADTHRAILGVAA